MEYALAFALRTYLDVPRGGWLANLLYDSLNRFFHQNHSSYFAVHALFVGKMLLMTTAVSVLVLVCMRYSTPSFAKFLAGPLSCLLPPFNFWDTYPDWLGGHGFGTLGAEVIFVLALLYGI